MHHVQTLLGEVAAILEIIQAIPYYISIFRRHTRPQRISYGIWLIIEVVEVAGYIASGATTTKWFLIICAGNSLAIFLLALKHSMGGSSRLDVASLLLAGLAIILWIATKSPAVAVYMSTLAGSIGFIPTIKKAYIRPNTENTLSWCIYVVAVIINVCALTTTRFVIVLPLVATLIFASTLITVLMFPTWKLGGINRLN